jgi:hypothetical protein
MNANLLDPFITVFAPFARLVERSPPRVLTEPAVPERDGVNAMPPKMTSTQAFHECLVVVLLYKPTLD